MRGISRISVVTGGDVAPADRMQTMSDRELILRARDAFADQDRIISAYSTALLAVRADGFRVTRRVKDALWTEIERLTAA